MEVFSLTSILFSIVLDAIVRSSQAMEYSRQSPLTTFNISGHLDKSVTLRCHFLTATHNRGWFMIKWYRLESDGSSLPLMQLSARGKVPEWSAKIPGHLQSRLQPIITLQPGHVEFNLIINNLTCTDEGDYRCSVITPDGEIISTAELGIYGGPQIPKIVYEYFPPSQPTRIEAICKADVGFKPKMLVWYIRRPHARYFTMIDKQPDVIQETDGCHTVSTRALDIDMVTETRGTHFRCGYPGYIEKDGMFDEIILDIDTQGVEEVRADGKMAATCDDGLCDLLDMALGDGSTAAQIYFSTQLPDNKASPTAARVSKFVVWTSAVITYQCVRQLRSAL